MGFFEKYPNTDFHELNLDWLLHKMKELEIEFDEFKVVNNITFSGQWDITKQYPAWTIVSDNNIGYVSQKPVPAGVVLTNTDYWVEVIDYTAQIAGLQNRVVAIENDISNNIDPAITTLQNDIVNLQNEITNWTMFKRIFTNKKVVIIGDSLSIPSVTWAEPFKALVESIGGTVDNRATGGWDAGQCLTDVLTLTDAYDIAIVWCGINDPYHNNSLGSYATPGTFNYNYKGIQDALHSLNANMLIYNFGLAYSYNYAYSATKSLYYYTAAIKQIADVTGAVFKDMGHVFDNSLLYRSGMVADTVHFTETYSKTHLLNTIIDAVCESRSDGFNEEFVMTNAEITAGTNVTLGLLHGVHNIGKFVNLSGTIVVGASLPINSIILTIDTGYVPNNIWFEVAGPAGAYTCRTQNGKDLTVYGTAIPVGTYVISGFYHPTYVDEVHFS